jgi:hypothetical protein
MAGNMSRKIEVVFLKDYVLPKVAMHSSRLINQETKALERKVGEILADK